MMKYKKYSAFISSHYASLKEERAELIRSLLDAQMIPICMEHFTATSSENFDNIKTLIDQSDIFIMLLGEVYGSCDKSGISWTEREYSYAKGQGKICYVIKVESYIDLANRSRAGEPLSEAQEKQLAFGEQISYAQAVTEERTIFRIVQQILSGTDFDSCPGWVRVSERYLAEWQYKNRFLDLRGRWYHVHLKPDDPSYIRAGDVTITQDFSPEAYTNLHFAAKNYNVEGINPKTESLTLNKMKRTVWSGDYLLKEDNQIIGVYNAERFFKKKYGEWEIQKGFYRGVHVLDIVDEDSDEDPTDCTVMLSGTFNDVFPSPKTGDLYLFRTKQLRYRFLYDNFQDTFRSKL